MTITATQVAKAMIPATREREKKIAAIHATTNETQAAASVVSFRIVIQVVVSVIVRYFTNRLGQVTPVPFR